MEKNKVCTFLVILWFHKAIFKGSLWCQTFRESSVMLLHVLLLLLRLLHSYQSEIVSMYPFLLWNNHCLAPEVPHPLIFVQNRSHQGVNMSDLLSDFKLISIKNVSEIIIKHNGMGWNPIWHPRWLPKLENIKILQLWLYPNNDGRRMFFWFNATIILGVYLENEYFTWY